ncbi:MAG: AAA family ATPase [Firmicutes bacterium]|nr:AAA family ATPase [Bacillota bacterium]
MNIKRAKEEIKDAIESYMLKDEFGDYVIPIESQRPVLLMGPPGIGKTAVMRQIAMECGIGLVAYTITHHTRQSAIGLPFIDEKEFGGKKYSVTEYTMSEIIASVYNKIEETGIKEGILFIDEINCASETLAPAMLQFLQYKTFGSHAVPRGWIIVAAGNPPQYNKSVREFDVVTLDRVKKIDVDVDYATWREYAVLNDVHNSVISYLDVRKENFYSVKNTADGKRFVTARGWEDLSRIIYVYEKLGKKADFEVVFQYLQDMKTAKDFAAYLELYYKYKEDYSISDIINGNFKKEYMDRLRTASFDEKLGVVSLVLGALNSCFKEVNKTDIFVSEFHAVLKDMKKLFENNSGFPKDIINETIEQRKNKLYAKKLADVIDKKDEALERNILDTLSSYMHEIEKNSAHTCDEGFELIKKLFGAEVEKREHIIEETSQKLENAFEFMEKTFGESQEMVIFVTELNSGYYSIKFINDNGSVKFYQYNKNLLYKQQQKSIISEMDQLNSLLENRIKGE